MIYIIGLGPNNSENFKPSLKKLLLENSENKIIVRTEEHPAVSFLKDNNISYETCDKFYTDNDDFSKTYEAIATYILNLAQNNNVIYLVPGHPMVAERTTMLLLESDNDVKVMGGESFLDSCFNAAKFDPVEGFSLIDATNLESLSEINPKQHNLITQCYDDLTAGDIALEIADYYPENHKILVMEQVGDNDEKLYISESIDELQLTVGEDINNLRTIYIPPFKDSPNYNIKKMIPEFNDDITNTSLIKNIEQSLDKIKNNDNEKNVHVELANILKNVLNFTNSVDGYYELKNILKNME